MFPKLERKYLQFRDAVNSENSESEIWESERFCRLLKALTNDTAEIAASAGLDLDSTLNIKKDLKKHLNNFDVSDADTIRYARILRTFGDPTLRHMTNCVCIAMYCSRADHEDMLKLLGLDELFVHEYAFYCFNLTGLTNLEVNSLIENEKSCLYSIGKDGGSDVAKMGTILEQVNYAMAYKYGPPLVKRLFGPGVIYADSDGEIIVEVESSCETKSSVIVVGETQSKLAFDSPDMERDSWLRNVMENMILVATELQTRLLLQRNPDYVEPVMMIFKGMLNFMSSKDIINKETKKGQKVLPLSLERRAMIQQMRDMTEIR